MFNSTRTRRVVLGVLVLSVISSGGTAAFAAKPASKHDNTPPSVSFAQPSAGATLSGTVTASGSSSDNVGVSSVQVSVDGGSWITASGTSSWSASVNTASYVNGAHTLYARATDTSGNVTTTTLSVSFSNGDTTAPTVSFSAPSSGTTVGGTATVSGTASDNVSVASVAVQVDGGNWQTVSGTTSWSWSWNTSGLANGSHTLTARSTDGSGNSSTTTESVNVSNTTADTTPPSVSITSPTGGATVAGTVTVSGSASDNVGVSSIAVQVDGGSWQTASGTGSWSWSWNSAGVANGSHTLTARATDASGNTSTASVTVSVSNTTSSSSAPNTQGSWVSPEGVTINVNTASSWTISQIYSMLIASARDLSKIGPGYTINVQDTSGSYSSETASCSNGVCSAYRATTWLNASAGTGFSDTPDDVVAHEYGHVWARYHLWIDKGGDWSTYLQARWSTSDGSMTLATDSRLDTSYMWNRDEIIADDYRLLFGSAAAISEANGHLNWQIPDPRNVPGLKDFLANQW